MKRFTPILISILLMFVFLVSNITSVHALNNYVDLVDGQTVTIPI